ncbi:hypothetical protein L1049_013524 [Liquidambar formosana]|uniref:Uncharacterized protein n=1 Tax=Liquidambar formosana TaxID=63359 RepID=A0AAP0RP05_LIQFO
MVAALLIPSLSSASFLNNEKFRICSYASAHPSKPSLNRFRVRAIKEKTEEIKTPSPSSSSASTEEITEKFGLEAGLWKVPINLLILLSVLFEFSALEINSYSCND